MGVIVVGYVPTPEGRAALRLAAEEATLKRVRLVVVSSQRGGREPVGSTAQPAAVLDEVADELTAAGVPHEVRQLVRGGDAAEDLISIAAEVSADLIVIGLRRRSPVGKLVLGSNAQRILLDAPCPVLAVKAG